MSEIKKMQSIEHVWSVLCISSSVDKESNNISLFNIVEQLAVSPIIKPPVSTNGKTVTTKPKNSRDVTFVQFPMEIVSFWNREESDKNKESPVNIEIDLIGPNKKSITKKEIEFVFKKGYKRTRFIIKLNGVEINTFGEYKYNINVKIPEKSIFENVAQIPLEIKAKVDLKSIK